MRHGETIHDVIKRIKEHMAYRDYEGVTGIPTVMSSDIFDLLRFVDSFLNKSTITVPPGKDLREVEKQNTNDEAADG